MVYKYIINRGIRSDEIYMLSLGCSNDEYNLNLNGFPLNILGLPRFTALARNGINNFNNMNNQNTNRIMQRILQSRYIRISPSGRQNIQLDGITRREIWILQSTARNMICDIENEKKIKDILEILKQFYIETLRRRGRNYQNIQVHNLSRLITRFDKYPDCYTEITNITNRIENCTTCITPGDRNNCAKCRPELKNLNNRILSNFKQTDEKIVGPFYITLFRDTCLMCKSLSIGYLPLVALLISNDYFSENYIHKCVNNWTPFHFIAANNEIASFIYLLKNRLFNVIITENLDTIVSYEYREIEVNITREIQNIMKNFRTRYLSSFPFPQWSTVEEVAPPNGEFISFINKVIRDLDQI